MTWIPNEKEIESVLSLDGPRRYAYCVGKVADWQKLWSLRGVEGWVLAGDDSGSEIVPVWPHEMYALLCANGIWLGCQAEAIDIEEWLDRWTPGMEKDGRIVGVFPTPSDKGILVEPKRLAEDLRVELSKYG